MKVTPATDASMVNINVPNDEPKKELPSKLKKYSVKAAVVLSYIISVVISYLVNLNQNVKMAQVDYFLYIIPKNLFFRLWIVIYVLLALVIAHNLWKDVWKTKSSLILVLSNLLMIVHIGIWSARTVASIVIGGCVLAFCDNVTIWFWRVLIDEYHESLEKEKIGQPNEVTQVQDQLSVSIVNQNEPVSGATPKKEEKQNRYNKWELLIVRNIFSLYIGWITVAGTVMIGMMVVYWWGLTLCEEFIVFWITTPIAACGIYLFMSTKQDGETKYCIGYLFSILWGIIGASIASFENVAAKGHC